MMRRRIGTSGKDKLFQKNISWRATGSLQISCTLLICFVEKVCVFCLPDYNCTSNPNFLRQKERNACYDDEQHKRQQHTAIEETFTRRFVGAPTKGHTARGRKR